MSISLKRVESKPIIPVRIARLDDSLEAIGFCLDADGSFFKKYSSPLMDLKISLACGKDDVSSVFAELLVKDPAYLDRSIREGEKIVRENASVILSFGNMIKIAQGLGGPSGPSGLHNVNIPMDFPGPRWWGMDVEQRDQEKYEDKVKDQTRYHPSYMPIGEAAGQPGSPRGYMFVPEQISYARLVKDRQRPILEYTTKDGRTQRVPVDDRGGIGDLSQESEKFKINLIPRNDGTAIGFTKVDSRGDTKGIWEINGRPEVPGFAYVDDDARTSYSLHPELLSDPDWTSGKWSPGRNNY